MVICKTVLSWISHECPASINIGHMYRICQSGNYTIHLKLCFGSLLHCVSNKSGGIMRDRVKAFIGHKDISFCLHIFFISFFKSRLTLPKIENLYWFWPTAWGQGRVLQKICHSDSAQTCSINPLYPILFYINYKTINPWRIFWYPAFLPALPL